MSRRLLGAAALAAALLMSAGAGAQGIFDLFGPDRPARAPRPPRDIPRAETQRAEGKKAEAKAKKRDGAKAPGTGKAQPEAGKAEPQNAEAPPPPYEGQLVRLSEVLGALAFLRDLCGDKDGDDWRDKMSALLEAEAPGGPRHDKYVAAFNRGFRGYELTYRVCTQNARTASARYLDEAAKISRDVTYRFGSP